VSGLRGAEVQRAGRHAAAFVTSDQETEIDASTPEYVERFVPDRSGANFATYVGIGMTILGDLGAPEVAPFDSFTFHPVSSAL
jgi:hypothetical protein